MADVLLLGFFGATILGGWSTGFVRRLAGLLFIAASFVLGGWLRAPVGAIVASAFPAMPKAYAEMIGYSVAFGVLVVVFNLVSGAVLSKGAVQGRSKVADKVLGAGLGLVEAALIASAAIVTLHTYSAEVAALAKLSGIGLLTDIVTGIDTSTIGKLLTSTAVPLVLAILGPLLPTDVTKLVPTTIPGLPGGSLPRLP